MSSSFQPTFERNQEATVYVGSLDLKVTEDILWELFTQCGPVVNVHLPRDKVNNDHIGYGFVEFKSEEDADYSIKIMHMIKLYGKPIKVSKASQDRKIQEVGATVFVSNLDPEVDEDQLKETFSTFGAILSHKVMRDPETSKSKGFGFISYDSFEASDNAINSMNGQFFANRNIHVSYAYKKDQKGEKHGSAAERFLALNRPTPQPKQMPNSTQITLENNQKLAYKNQTQQNFKPQQQQQQNKFPSMNPNMGGSQPNFPMMPNPNMMGQKPPLGMPPMSGMPMPNQPNFPTKPNLPNNLPPFPK